MGRVYNFSAGPAVLPEEVFEGSSSMKCWIIRDRGMSVMEMSHRSKVYSITSSKTAEAGSSGSLMNIPDNYKVLFLQGGASLAVCHDPR